MARSRLALPLFFFVLGANVYAFGEGEPIARYAELREMIGRSEFDKAIEQNETLISKFPSFTPFYETLPEVCQYADRLQEALAFFEKRVEEGTELGLAYFGLGRVRYLQEDYRGAVSDLSMSIDLGVRAPVVYKYFEYAYERVDGVDNSIRLLDGLSHRFPENACYWYATALAYWSKNDFKKALHFLDEAVSRRPNEQEFRIAEIAAMYLCGRVRDAEKRVQRGIEAAKAAGDFGAAIWLRSYIVGQRLRRRAFPECVEHCRTIIVEAKRYGYHRLLGWGWYRLSDAVQLQGNYVSALPFIEQAVRSAVLSKDFELLKFALASEFQICIEAGEYGRALRVALRNAQLSERRRDILGLAGALNDLARIHHEMGESAVALALAREALTVAETSPLDDRTICQIHSTMGLAYQGLGQNGEALRHLGEADRMNPNDGFKDWLESIMKGNLGGVWLDLGKLSEARRIFAKQLQLARRAHYDREIAYAYANIGQCEYRMHRISTAILFLDSALFLAQKRGYRPIALICSKWLAKSYESQGQLPVAAKWYRHMSLLVDSLLENLEQLPFRHRMLSSLGYYVDFVNLLTRMNLDEEAFEISDESKVADGCRVEPVNLPEATSDSIRADLRRRRESIHVFYSSLSSALPLKPLSRWLRSSESMGEENTRQLIRIQSEYLSLLDSLKGAQKVESFRGIGPGLLLRFVQDSVLQNGEGLLEYFVGPTCTHIFFATRHDFKHLTMRASTVRLEKLVGVISDVFGQKRGNQSVWNPGLGDFDVLKSAKLYDFLIGDLEKEIRSLDKLVFIADGILSNFPFESLAACVLNCQGPSDYSMARFLIQTHEVRYLASATPCFPRDRYRAAMKEILGVPASLALRGETDADLFHQRIMKRHDYAKFKILPGVEREIEGIREIFGGSADVLHGNPVKIDLQSCAKNYKVVHFSAHSKPADDFAVGESLCLSPAPGEDRSQNLTGPDLAGMGLRAELVVLSSCQYGSPDKQLAQRDLVHGVLVSGSRSVIAALWGVDDGSAPEFMRTFYTMLKAGATKGRALQLAKIGMIESGLCDPFNWAAFVLVGDGDLAKFSESRDVGSQGYHHRMGLALIICSLLLLCRILSEMRHAFRLTDLGAILLHR